MGLPAAQRPNRIPAHLDAHLANILCGLALASLALTPSLVPRPTVFQGFLAGLWFMVGFQLGFAVRGLRRVLAGKAPRKAPRKNPRIASADRGGRSRSAASGGRGADVSDSMRWIPGVTFLHLVTDMLVSEAVPPSHGHNFGDVALDGWAQVLPGHGRSDAQLASIQSVIERIDTHDPIWE